MYWGGRNAHRVLYNNNYNNNNKNNLTANGLSPGGSGYNACT